MYKIYTFFLPVLLLLSLIHLVSCINIDTTLQDYIPRDVNIDRSSSPKNVLFGSFIGGRSLVKPMLDIAAILIERGHNVRINFFFLKEILT